MTTLSFWNTDITMDTIVPKAIDVAKNTNVAMDTKIAKYTDVAMDTDVAMCVCFSRW